MIAIAAAAGTESGGTHVLLSFAMIFAFFSFIFWAFTQRKGGPDGGAEKQIVGALFLLAAVIVGILLGTGGKHSRGSAGEQIRHQRHEVGR